MVEKSQGAAAEGEQIAPAPAPAAGAPRRTGHRGMDPRETVAELTARAHEISQHAGGKVAAAMKDVIGAAAGLTGFAVESARDLIQYMVRRGQMTQMEGDKLLREVEAAHGTRSPSSKADAALRATSKPSAGPASAPMAAREAKSAAEKPRAAKKADASAAEKPATEKPARKAAEKTPAPKPAAPRPAAKKAAAKGAAKKAAPKGSASRSTAAPRSKAASKSAPTRKKK